MFRYYESWGSSGAEHVISCWEDNGVTYDPAQWTDLLANASVVLVEWSKAGINWSSFTVVLDDPAPQVKRFLRATIPPAVADGTEYLVRLTIDGVQYPVLSVRWYS